MGQQNHRISFGDAGCVLIVYKIYIFQMQIVSAFTTCIFVIPITFFYPPVFQQHHNK
jgi:hypothetical protein